MLWAAHGRVNISVNAAVGASTLTLTSVLDDDTPELTIANEDILEDDIIHVEYGSSATFNGTEPEVLHTVSAAEETAGEVAFVSEALENGTWYFRARVDRAGSASGEWSNTVEVFISDVYFGAPVLELLTDGSDNTPEFNVSSDLVEGDVVRLQWATDDVFTTPSSTTVTVSDADDESDADTIGIVADELVDDEWFFRARIERPNVGYSEWSNVESVVISTV